MITNDPDRDQRFIDDVFRLWLVPELARRGLNADTPEAVVAKALIQLGGAERADEIRLNDEVAALARIEFEIDGAPGDEGLGISIGEGMETPES